jgi:hypothetical protein
MKLQIYTIRDLQANRAMAPLFRENDAIARRDFTNMVNAEPGPNNPFALNPEDYTLYHIGEWDDEITANSFFSEPIRLLNGKEAIKAENIKRGQIEALEHEIAKLKDKQAELNGQSYGGTD